MCENAEALAERLVGEWLEAYMFACRDDAHDLAGATAHWFNNHQVHQSHGLGIDRDTARAQQITIDDLEEDGEVQDRVLSAFHATTIAFNQSPAVKLIENHLGRRFLKSVQVQQIQFPFPVAPAASPPSRPQA